MKHIKNTINSQNLACIQNAKIWLLTIEFNADIDVWKDCILKYHRWNETSHTEAESVYRVREEDYKILGIDLGLNIVPKGYVCLQFERKLNK